MIGILIIFGLGLTITLLPGLIYFLSPGRPRIRKVALGLGLSGITMTLLFIGLEAFWQLAGSHLPPGLMAKIPEELKRRDIPGTRDYYWHGHLFHFNAKGFRGAEWPPKSTQVLRIMCLGDSLTYGEGIAEEDTYPSVLSHMLNKTYRVEILNLGACGYQVSDVRKVLEQHFDELHPDLVTYGMCLNDYLPSMKPQYEGDQYPVPLPLGFKNWLAGNTAVFAFLTQEYDGFLRRFHFRRDFFDDILISLKNDTSLKQDFLRDCAAMSRLMAARGKPPILAMVVHQFRKDPRGRLLDDKSQELMRRAGMEVLDDKPYFRGLENENLTVSPWEGHPSSACQRIFAQILYDGLVKIHPDVLSRYSRN